MNPPKVLLVDDEKEICEDLEKQLSGMGYNTHIAHSRTEANFLIKQHAFNLAVIDIMLPDGDGFQIYEDLRAKFPHIYAIIITGNTTLDHAVEAINKGVDAYLLKPFSAEQFGAALQQADKMLSLREDNRRLLEENLNMRQFFENLLNSTGEAVFVVSLDFDIQYCNLAAQRFLNSDKSILMNRSLQSYIEDGYKVLNHIYQQLMVGKKIGGYRVKLKSENDEGNEVNLSADFLYNQKEHIEGIIITMEIASLQNELFNRILRKEKFTSLTNLASALAHEIRNPINILYGRMQLLRNEIDDPKYQKTFATINRQVDRISDIIRLLAKFNMNHDDTIPETFAFIEFFEDFIKKYQKNHPAIAIRINSQQSDKDVMVEASKIQFEDAFAYLFTAIEEIGAPNLKIEISYNTARTFTTKPWVAILLQFNQSLPVENIFEPFKLLSQQDSQSSLGLAIMHTIFSNHGVKLNLEHSADHKIGLQLQLPIVEVVETSKKAPAKKKSKVSEKKP